VIHLAREGYKKAVRMACSNKLEVEPKNTHRFVHRTSIRNRKDFTQTPIDHISIDLDYTLQQKKDYKKAVSGRPQKWACSKLEVDPKNTHGLCHRTSMDQNDPTPEHP